MPSTSHNAAAVCNAPPPGPARMAACRPTRVLGLTRLMMEEKGTPLSRASAYSILPRGRRSSRGQQKHSSAAAAGHWTACLRDHCQDRACCCLRACTPTPQAEHPT